MLRRSSASSGMMLAAVPAWIAPTVTTTMSVAAISREAMVWSRRTVEAAITTGSTAAPGAGGGAQRGGAEGGRGARAVPASAVQGDADRVGRGERRAGAQAQHAGRDGCHVLAQHHVGAAEPVEQAVVD